jgi:hypothetical protein
VLRGNQRRRAEEQLAGRLAAGDGGRRHGGWTGAPRGRMRGEGALAAARRVALAGWLVQAVFDRVARGSGGHRRKRGREWVYMNWFERQSRGARDCHGGKDNR